MRLAVSWRKYPRAVVLFITSALVSHASSPLTQGTECLTLIEPLSLFSDSQFRSVHSHFKK